MPGLNSEDPIPELTVLAILNAAIFGLSIFEVHFFIRIFPKFSELVQLIGKVLYDVGPFSTYFIGWLLAFSQIFQMIGIQNEDGGVLSYMEISLMVYQNSIGDLNMPNIEIW